MIHYLYLTNSLYNKACLYVRALHGIFTQQQKLNLCIQLFNGRTIWLQYTLVCVSCVFQYLHHLATRLASNIFIANKAAIQNPTIFSKTRLVNFNKKYKLCKNLIKFKGMLKLHFLLGYYIDYNSYHSVLQYSIPSIL